MVQTRGRGRPRAGEELDVGQLLQGALEAFAEKGYDGTSVRELSRRLGVSHALLTARFNSKEGLWFAAMDHALAAMSESWRRLADDPGLDDLEALRQAVVSQLIFSAAHPEVLRIMSHEGATDSPRIRYVVDHFITPLRPLVEQRIDRLVAAGRIRRVPYETLHYLVVIGGGARYASPVETQLLGGTAEHGEEDIRRHAETVADVIVRGLAG
ncbi:TetR/AcrR family transcriptional regulator [Streptomyces sp. SID13031]|uniref:TetR/AcrR family transcriptional regulator n=1 Tax=Streptomyces sp. SID13031 TaxID=2706046 RepID=UPI0013CC048E|nr:TetR/AcrR family transcriptional regulator [Streptomyces sp. SID13031]NEA37198.1 TetR/AcrR family transcriptional regulator [Streptomyces sp. SID13031]